jgi:hypothetical protein
MGVADFLRRQKEGIQTGWETALEYMNRRVQPEVVGQTVVRTPDYRHSVFDPRFNRALRQGEKIVTDAGVKQITAPLTTPAEFIGAYAARLLTDVGTDSTRQFYWRYNHPMALAEKAIEQVVPQLADIESPTKRAAITLGISAPVAASLGTFDITNPQELFRPKGYAQSYAEKGAEDRRVTAEPGMEIFDRFFLGRRGQPLKYETAKQDIPDLTPERYKKALQSQYQDRGLLGLGLVKGTTENIQGYPEVRIVGFPVGLQAAGALAGGTVAARQALQQPGLSTRGKAGITLAGSLAGAMLGNLTNKAIASAQNSPEKLPSTLEYQQSI